MVRRERSPTVGLRAGVRGLYAVGPGRKGLHSRTGATTRDRGHVGGMTELRVMAGSGDDGHRGIGGVADERVESVGDGRTEQHLAEPPG
ncbi:hypothetical protein GCM10018965_078320 [Nonomuraea roseola]